MKTGIEITVKSFLDIFEEVFDKDWEYTKMNLGIYEETEEQKKNSLEMGLEPIYFIEPEGTFLKPKVADEYEDWGNRGQLLREYRKLKELLNNIP